MKTFRLVDHAAKKLATTEAHMDARGRDRDDYRQLLLMRVWLASQSAPDHGQNARERWEFVAVRNQLRSYKRELKRQPEFARWELLAEEEQPHAPSLERLTEIRQVLRKAEAYLKPFEAGLLVSWVEHGCSSRSVWDARGRPGAYLQFCRKLHHIRTKCRQYVQKICPEIGPNKRPPAL
ncbi:MAG: hypothetical protein A2Y61_00370 [Chloroflexi bacterium RBG_13_60_13]|nr:MAG: hypothetical protein A2Y61_00370 [Chloroflexi bacterium RBG_13_60_13]